MTANHWGFVQDCISLYILALLYCLSVLPADSCFAHVFIQQLSYLLVVRLQFLVSGPDKDLPYILLPLGPASVSTSTCIPCASPFLDVE